MLNAYRKELKAQKIKLTKINLEETTGLTKSDVIELVGLRGLEEAVNLSYDDIIIDGEYPIVQIKLSNSVIAVMKREIHIDQMYIYNDEIRLRETGTGLGSEIFEKEIHAVKKAGLTKVVCHAFGNIRIKKKWNGYIFWAKCGYSMRDEINRVNLQQIIDKHIAINSSLLHLKGATVHYFVMDKKGEAIWEQEGSSWWGEFHLSADSENWRDFAHYKRVKLERRLPKN